MSWISPIARALLKAKVGDTVTLHTPAGVQQIDILDVRYPPKALSALTLHAAYTPRGTSETKKRRRKRRLFHIGTTRIKLRSGDEGQPLPTLDSGSTTCQRR